MKSPGSGWNVYQVYKNGWNVNNPAATQATNKYVMDLYIDFLWILIYTKYTMFVAL